MWKSLFGNADKTESFMTAAQIAQRDAWEAVVERGLTAALAVREAGVALGTLKETELWRDTHDTWQTYVQERFGITPRRAHQLIEFAVLHETIHREIGTAGTGLTERAIRPLTSLPADQIQGAISEAFSASGGGSDMPAAIRAAVARRKKPLKVAKRVVVRVGGARLIVEPTAAYRGLRETLVAAIEKLDGNGEQRAA